jgi:hypothetical protein
VGVAAEDDGAFAVDEDGEKEEAGENEEDDCGGEEVEVVKD